MQVELLVGLLACLNCLSACACLSVCPSVCLLLLGDGGRHKPPSEPKLNPRCLSVFCLSVFLSARAFVYVFVCWLACWFV